jgi:hypothetical protein
VKVSRNLAHVRQRQNSRIRVLTVLACLPLLFRTNETSQSMNVLQVPFLSGIRQFTALVGSPKLRRRCQASTKMGSIYRRMLLTSWWSMPRALPPMTSHMTAASSAPFGHPLVKSRRNGLTRRQARHAQLEFNSRLISQTDSLRSSLNVQGPSSSVAAECFLSPGLRRLHAETSWCNGDLHVMNTEIWTSIYVMQHAG